MFSLVVYDEHAGRHEIGSVKIGQFGMKEGQRRPDIPARFDALDDRFFSLGQDDTYYQELAQCGAELRDRILRALHDLAADEGLLRRALKEQVTTESLLRSVSPVTIRGKFRRLARGDSALSRYSFTYQPPSWPKSAHEPPQLTFSVEPNAEPPTNLHVLIGRNGVGKTTLLRGLVRAFLGPDARSSGKVLFAGQNEREEGDSFANLASVTFSAFDPFTNIEPDPKRPASLRYLYIGLQGPEREEGVAARPKSLADLKNEFVESATRIQKSKRAGRWRDALVRLEADPLFAETGVTELVAQAGISPNRDPGRQFEQLSSGHKVVLLTITKLVEVLEERTLVLLDEPEAHLHPPLLSAFMRAISDLLLSRNGVGIVATHSPVVLQEVPRTCVWMLRRVGSLLQAERPGLETFGENVSVLTREAFGLEVTESGFHGMLRDVVQEGLGFEEARERFDRQLGTEAVAILRGLVASRQNSDNQGAG